MHSPTQNTPFFQKGRPLGFDKQSPPVVCRTTGVLPAERWYRTAPAEPGRRPLGLDGRAPLAHLVDHDGGAGGEEDQSEADERHQHPQ